MTSHTYAQCVLFLALYILFRIDPASAQAATMVAALPLWEAHPENPFVR